MTILLMSTNIGIARFRKLRIKMKDIKLYIEVVYSQDGSSFIRIVREYVNWLNNTEYNILAKYKNNFLGKFRAKRKLAKWKKYHELHDFSGDNEYSVIEEIIY